MKIIDFQISKCLGLWNRWKIYMQFWAHWCAMCDFI